MAHKLTVVQFTGTVHIYWSICWEIFKWMYAVLCCDLYGDNTAYICPNEDQIRPK